MRPSALAICGLGTVLLLCAIALRSLLRAQAGRRARDHALGRGCICPVASRRRRGATRDGFRFHRPDCPVHAARVAAIVHGRAWNWTLLAYAAALGLLGLALATAV